MSGFPESLDADRGVYGISVAAELVGMGVQTLRLYETRGLLEPGRTDGGTRRYATNDLHRLRRIGELVDAGLNIAGIAMVLDLEAHNAQLLAEKEQTAMEPTASDEIFEAAEADLIEQYQPAELPDPDDGYPHTMHTTPAALEPGDPLLAVAVRVYADFADHTTLTDTIGLVLSCRDQLDVIASPAGLPELVERLARRRLADAPAASPNLRAP